MQHHVFLSLLLERLNEKAESFFRTAYLWKFPDKPLPDQRVFWLDGKQYEMFGIIPTHVHDYISHLKTAGELPPP